MKYIYILFILVGCASDIELISEGKVYIDMTQSELKEILTFSNISSDAFLNGCFRRYFIEARVNVLAAEDRKIYYVFNNVSQPSIKCSETGDGHLLMILNKEEYDEYKFSF